MSTRISGKPSGRGRGLHLTSSFFCAIYSTDPFRNHQKKTLLCADEKHIFLYVPLAYEPPRFLQSCPRRDSPPQHRAELGTAQPTRALLLQPPALPRAQLTALCLLSTRGTNLHLSIHNKAKTYCPKSSQCFNYHAAINPRLSTSSQICQKNNIIQLFAITQKHTYNRSSVFGTWLQKFYFYFFIRKPALSVHWPSTKVLQISPKFP